MKKKTASVEVSRPAPAAERIRRSARQLFYDHGIRAVGVDAIVAGAGVTKPTLYRSFSSKDDLTASYLHDYEAEFWACFDAAVAAHPSDPRAQILAYFDKLIESTKRPGPYRGCGLSNALVEYPESDHPARKVAVAHKRELRARLATMARDMGARDPDALGDGLLLLLEGAFMSGQIFGRDGPAPHLREMADRLIAGSL
ncbi:TetR/AcrR family transcriptional regulator [Paraburkholderia sp. GAS42]|uniref:TetR/AcrR family transcriptional regulator n=1 Tax=Paraburkholderia sp. GAS42 TaxID=3035135 RepID=UPI003D236C1F